MSADANIWISSGSIAVYSFPLDLGSHFFAYLVFFIMHWTLQKIGCRDFRFSYLLLRSAEFCFSRKLK